MQRLLIKCNGCEERIGCFIVKDNSVNIVKCESCAQEFYCPVQDLGVTATDYCEICAKEFLEILEGSIAGWETNYYGA